MKFITVLFVLLLKFTDAYNQNSLTGDGFGGRLWYKSSNYSVGSYTGYSICGIDKQLYAWGGNNMHQLGNSSINTNGSLTPVECTNMKNVIFFASGYMSGAIKDDNSGWIWDDYNSTPIKVIDSVYFVDAGEHYLAFVKLDGTIWCLGKNDYGVFGNGNLFDNYSIMPSKMNLINNAVRVAVSDKATLILTSSGEVYSVGANYNYQLGIDSIPSNSVRTTPIKVNKLKNIIDIKATTESFLALDSDGFVWTWGNGTYYFTQSKEPEKLPNLNNIVAISSCVDGHSCFALDSAKDCYAWGVCDWGQCSSEYGLLYLPSKVATHVEDIMMGESFSYIIRSDGSLWASGQSLPEVTGINGSIWLNLSNNYRKYFTKLNPASSEIGLCKPINIVDTMLLEDLSPPVSTEKIIFMPNVFSPNNDNLNDIFRPINPTPLDFKNYKLLIYNRWGQELFSTKDVMEGWDGKFKGQPCEIGTYFYLITYDTNLSKQKQLNGECILIR